MMPRSSRIRNLVGLLVITCLVADASAQTMDALLTNWGSYVVATYNLVTIIFALTGVWMVAHALMGFYHASQEKQQGKVPVRAYWVALCVGGVLTSIGTIAAILRNSLTQ